VVKIKKSCGSDIDNKNDVATATTVATIWTTERLKFFAVHRDATISAATCRSMESYSIDERCHLTLPSLNSYSNKKRARICADPPKKSPRLSDGSWNYDVYNLATASATESNFASRQCEQCVIFADANICTWVENCSALTDQDFARLYDLSCITLNSKVLRI
jgi:hypothetical protein